MVPSGIAPSPAVSRTAVTVLSRTSTSVTAVAPWVARQRQ
jgi:hypothetical protein